MKKTQLKKSSNAWIIVTTIGFMLITITVGIFAFRFYLNGFKEVKDDNTYGQYYVMITEERKSSFWQSVYRGAYERGLEENVYVDLLGDNLSQEYSREDLMRIAISSAVDGIIVAADESDEMTQLIDEAVAEGIPVVTLYGDNTHSSRCSFVGVGNYNLGREYGRQVLKIAEEKTQNAYMLDTDEQYNVDQVQEKQPIKVAVLVNVYALDSGQNIFCSGIQDAIDQEKTEETEIEISLISVDDTNAFSVEESIRDIFMEEELPDIIVCLNELNTTCVYQAVVDYNKVGQIAILGYFDSDTIINAIDRNVINATISIDTGQMGRFCVDALTEYYEFGNTSQYFTADVTLIDKSNVSGYLEGGDEDEN